MCFRIQNVIMLFMIRYEQIVKSKCALSGNRTQDLLFPGGSHDDHRYKRDAITTLLRRQLVYLGVDPSTSALQMAQPKIRCPPLRRASLLGRGAGGAGCSPISARRSTI